jgi:hypothetical protein
MGESDALEVLSLAAAGCRRHRHSSTEQASQPAHAHAQCVRCATALPPRSSSQIPPTHTHPIRPLHHSQQLHQTSVLDRCRCRSRRHHMYRRHTTQDKTPYVTPPARSLVGTCSAAPARLGGRRQQARHAARPAGSSRTPPPQPPPHILLRPPTSDVHQAGKLRCVRCCLPSSARRPNQHAVALLGRPRGVVLVSSSSRLGSAVAPAVRPACERGGGSRGASCTRWCSSCARRARTTLPAGSAGKT